MVARMMARVLLFILVAPVLGLAGFFFGWSLGLAGALEDWILKYQALIAGVLAVIAGVATAGTMIVLDHRVAARHIQLMRLNTRSERLIVNRCAGQIPNLKRLAEYCLEWDKRQKIEVDAKGQISGNFEQVDWKDMRRRLSDAKMFSELSEGRFLFGPGMNARFVALEEIFRRAESASDEFQSLESGYGGNPSKAGADMRSAVSGIADNLPGFIDDLTSLRDEYDSNIETRL